MTDLLSSVKQHLNTDIAVEIWAPMLVTQGHSHAAIWAAICATCDDAERRKTMAEGIVKTVPWRSRARVARITRSNLPALVRTCQLAGMSYWLNTLMRESRDLEAAWVTLCALQAGGIERADWGDHFLRARPRGSFDRCVRVIEASGIHPLSIALGCGNRERGRRLIRKMFPGQWGLASSLQGWEGWNVPLSWFSGLRRPGWLPENLKLPGELRIGPKGPCIIPRGIEADHLTVDEGVMVERVEGQLRIRGTLNLQAQPGLVFLGDDIRVGREAFITEAPLTHLGHGFKVDGNLTLSLPHLQTLPMDLEVGGTLKIVGCPHLRGISRPGVHKIVHRKGG